MDARPNSSDMSERVDDGGDDKPQSQDSKTAALQTAFKSGSIPAGALSDVSSFSEQISTEDTELSSADISVNANKTAEQSCISTSAAEVPAGSNKQNKTGGRVSRAVSICSLTRVEREQPKATCALRPPPAEACCTAYEVSQSVTSQSKTRESKTTSAHTEPGGEDLCAAVLLACLFCHPLDCLLATMQGCNSCVWSLCSSACGCGPSALQPLLDVAHQCQACGFWGVRCLLCDCPLCDTCHQATECLDLAMEISQILYH